MEPLFNILSFMSKNNLMATLIAIAIGFVSELLCPFPQLQFLSKEKSGLIAMVVWIVVWYLAIHSFGVLFSKYKDHRYMCKHKKESAKMEVKDEKRKIAEFKAQIVDKWPDYEYSVVMWLLNNKNEKPYKEIFEPNPASIFYNEKIFNKTYCNEPVKLTIIYPNGKKTEMRGYAKYQYLLKPNMYETLLDIYIKTGSISTFRSRHEFKLYQDE